MPPSPPSDEGMVPTELATPAASMAAPEGLTNAQFARWLGVVGRLIAGASATQAEGMWNPRFCSARAENYAGSIYDEMQTRLDWLRSRLTDGPLEAQAQPSQAPLSEQEI